MNTRLYNRDYKYKRDTSSIIEKTPVTTTSDGLLTADDIVDASKYMSYRRSDWINRSKYAIYIVLLITAIIIISKSEGWSNYWKEFKSNLSGVILNVFSVMLIIDILSVWFIDLTVMRGVEYTYNKRFMANQWKPSKQISKNSDSYTELKNTCPGLHKYGRFVWPSLNV